MNVSRRRSSGRFGLPRRLFGTRTRSGRSPHRTRSRRRTGRAWKIVARVSLWLIVFATLGWGAAEIGRAHV